MSDDLHARQLASSTKARPLWRPLDALRTSMVKQVFAKEHFTHKKGLQFTPMVHSDEGHAESAPAPSEPTEAVEETTEIEATAAQEAPAESPERLQQLQEVRAQAFAEGLAQGMAQGQQQAQQAQAQDAQAQLAAQTAAHTQALLQEIDQKVSALVEDPAQLQEPLKRLALHLAEQLVLSELTLSPQAISQLIQRCVDTLDAADAATLVVELNPQDLALLQAQPRAEGQPQPAWRLQTDHALLPGSVRVRADDAVVSDLIENRLESLACSLLQDPKAWQTKSAFEPSKLASRLASQRGSAHTVEDALAKPQPLHSAAADAWPAAESAHPDMSAPQTFEHAHTEPEPEPDDALHDAEASDDNAEQHTYEAHAVMAAATPPPAATPPNLADTLSEIAQDLDKLDG